jgi:hypothetical protein
LYYTDRDASMLDNSWIWSTKFNSKPLGSLMGECARDVDGWMDGWMEGQT